MSAKQVSRLYRLRWQVELLFKLWKCEAQLARIAGERQPRVMGELYTKLIGLVLFAYLSAPMRLTEEELSLVKAWQTFQRQVERLAPALRGTAAVEAVLTKLYTLWSRFALKELPKNRPTTLRQLQLEFVNSLT